ncbi:MAG: hypothetical protein AUI14_11090 [Actinobacteria bacterium 13_2_20CM_2_71_6]|nr:MAG: hypothetical protein AUI14_11090 [Actinobacteria bacterium 13_2_20CM_2_71_6]
MTGTVNRRAIRAAGHPGWGRDLGGVDARLRRRGLLSAGPTALWTVLAATTLIAAAAIYRYAPPDPDRSREPVGQLTACGAG